MELFCFIGGIGISAFLCTLFFFPHQREAYWEGREDGRLISEGKEPIHEENYKHKKG